MKSITRHWLYMVLCTGLHGGLEAAVQVRWQRWLAYTWEYMVHLSGQHARGFQMGYCRNLRGGLCIMYLVYE